MLGRKMSWAVGVGLVTVLVLGGCGDDDDAVVPGVGTGSISFTVDGAPKTYSTNAIAGASGGITTIAATANTGPAAIGFIIDGVSTGIYTVDLNTVMVLYTDDAGTDFSAVNGVAGSGTLTITSFGAVGGRIEGTFSAIVDDGGSTTLDIISGTFSVVRQPDA
ncbi:MAG: hypothetical protein ACYS9X_03240 [Planctomycetota bacterium]